MQSRQTWYHFKQSSINVKIIWQELYKNFPDIFEISVLSDSIKTMDRFSSIPTYRIPFQKWDSSLRADQTSNKLALNHSLLIISNFLNLLFSKYPPNHEESSDRNDQHAGQHSELNVRQREGFHQVSCHSLHGFNINDKGRHCLFWTVCHENDQISIYKQRIFNFITRMIKGGLVFLSWDLRLFSFPRI